MIETGKIEPSSRQLPQRPREELPHMEAAASRRAIPLLQDDCINTTSTWTGSGPDPSHSKDKTYRLDSTRSRTTSNPVRARSLDGSWPAEDETSALARAGGQGRQALASLSRRLRNDGLLSDQKTRRRRHSDLKKLRSPSSVSTRRRSSTTTSRTATRSATRQDAAREVACGGAERRRLPLGEGYA